MKTLKIAEFSDFPAGRSKEKDPYSGEQYREDILLPAVKEGEVMIDFTDVYACLPSFLEEAFGGLVRADVLPPKDVKERIKFVPTDSTKYQDYIFAINKYIDDAIANREKHGAQ